MTRSFLGIVELIIAIASIIVIRNDVKAKRREGRQAELTKLSEVLKPGITRKQVEDYLRTQNLTFRQICRNQNQEVFATEVLVAQEEPLWFCSGWGVYVDFEFTALEPDRYSIRPPSDGDVLSDMHLVRKGDGCL
jgi:hypothetical protein